MHWISVRFYEMGDIIAISYICTSTWIAKKVIGLQTEGGGRRKGSHPPLGLSTAVADQKLRL